MRKEKEKTFERFLQVHCMHGRSRNFGIVSFLLLFSRISILLSYTIEDTLLKKKKESKDI
jgi:hypothetical protein